MEEKREEIMVQVVSIDYYMHRPPKSYGFIRYLDGPSPVVRVYGSTNAGQRTLVHVHGVFPYLYFRPASVNDTSFEDESQVQSYLSVFHRRLETEFEKRREAAVKGDAVFYKKRHVHNMEVVSKVPLYGYFESPKVFVKIYLRDPSDVKLLITLLEAGCLGAPMQPYEGHFPYLLQFTNDYNIQPMNWLYIDQFCKFRSPLPDTIAFPSPGQSLSTLNLISKFASQYELTSKNEQVTVVSSKVKMFSSPRVPNTIAHSDIEDLTTIGTKNSTNDLPTLQPNDIFPTMSLDKLFTSTTVPESMCWDKGLDDNTDIPRQMYNPTKKISCCELELDIEVSSIINQYMTRGKFGAELWEEESSRRIRKGLEAHCFPTPPFTATTYRAETETERDFKSRIDNLYDKGKVLHTINPAKRLRRLLSLSQLTPPQISIYDTIHEQDIGSKGNDAKIFPIREDLQVWLKSLEAEEIENINKGAVLTQVFQNEELSAEMSQNLIEANDEQREANEEFYNDNDNESEFSDEDSNKHNIKMTNDCHSVKNHRDSIIYKDIEDILASTQSETHDNQTLISNLPAYVSPNKNAQFVNDHNAIINPLASETSMHLLEKERTQSSTQTFVRREKRKVSMVSVFDTKRRKTVMFADDPQSNLESVKSHSNTCYTPDNISSSQLNSHEYTSPNYLVTNTQASPVFVNDSGKQTMVLCLASLKPPSRKNLRSMSFFNQASVINKPVHMTVQKDWDEHNNRAPGTSQNKTPQQAVLNRRRNEVKYLKNLLPFDGGFIPESNILYSLPVVHMNENPPIESFPQPIKKFTLGLSAPEFTPDSQDETIDQNVILNIDAVDEAYPLTRPLENSFLNISRDSAKYLSLKFDGALEFIKSLVSLANSDTNTSSQYFTRCLIPTFKPPLRSIILSLFSTCKSNDKINSDSTVPDSPSKIALSNSRINLPKKKLKYKKSQIATPSPTNSVSQKSSLAMKVGKQTVKDSVSTKNFELKKSRLTTMSLEVFCCTRKNLLPNPKHDAVQMVAWSVEDVVSSSETQETRRLHGIIMASKPESIENRNDISIDERNSETNTGDINKHLFKEDTAILKSSGLQPDTTCIIAENEQGLYKSIISIVKYLDPDILVGYDVQSSSWGYIINRGNILGLNMLQQLSKIPNEKPSTRNDYDEYSQEHESGIFITGRIIFNMWRRMRSELKIMSNTFSSVAEHLLQCRVPVYSCEQLTRWFKGLKTKKKTILYYHLLSELNLLFLDKLDLLNRLSECARLYGIDLFSVVSRGSQYRVEAALIYIAHYHGFIAISPSRRQVANQAAMACIPLVMEPHPSKFYHDPVVVLDFQSLYPSMIIAYNLCYSTCIGQLLPGKGVAADTTNRLGVIDYPEKMSAQAVFQQTSACDRPYLAPNGALFCTKSTREGVLPRMLREILNTRVMVKKAMKEYSGDGDKVLRRVLDARQLAIKLLANVTYGYAAAGFSGRMPMAELADAIVQSGRSTLEWTIKEIETNPKWKACVVYGDTDSVFVSLPGRNKADAFAIGREIANVISSKSPADVILKFEKVYESCILVTKKRYVGWSYESEDQKLPHLDAKGIECIRRDQCPITMKIQEACLRLLFKTRDLSQVKLYLQDQWGKILQGGNKLPLKDFVFRKEVRYGKYNPSSLPPGAIVVNKAVNNDEMAIPPYRWKVPYVVISGLPKALLSELIITPVELLGRGNNSHRINSVYYIEKCINPALVRVLSLCGADVNSWYRDMNKPKLRRRHLNYDSYTSNISSKNPLEQFLKMDNQPVKSKIQMSMDLYTFHNMCEICGEHEALPKKSICGSCFNSSSGDAIILAYHRLNIALDSDRALQLICTNCSHEPQHAALFQKGEMVGKDCCQSIDCSIFFERCRIVTRIEDYQIVVNDFS